MIDILHLLLDGGDRESCLLISRVASLGSKFGQLDAVSICKAQGVGLKQIICRGRLTIGRMERKLQSRQRSYLQSLLHAIFLPKI